MFNNVAHDGDTDYSPTDSKIKSSVFYNICVLMFMYYTVCYFIGLVYAVVRQISMLFIDNKDSVFCILYSEGQANQSFLILPYLQSKR